MNASPALNAWSKDNATFKWPSRYGQKRPFLLKVAQSTEDLIRSAREVGLLTLLLACLPAPTAHVLSPLRFRPQKPSNVHHKVLRVRSNQPIVLPVRRR